MKHLMRTYIDICLLRANPQDLPASTFLLALAILWYYLGSLILAMVSLDFGIAFLFALVDTLLLSVLAWLLLWTRNLASRFEQTLSALAGTGALLSVFGWPILLWEHTMAGDLNEAVLPAMLLLVIMIWNIVVIGHILRHALSTSMAFAAALSILYMFVSLNVLRGLFFTVG